MMTIEQWAEENEIDCETIKLVKGKTHNWIEWTEDCGLLDIKKRKKIHKDKYNMDHWIVDICNGQERWYFAKYYNFDGVKKYDFFNEKEEINKELHTKETAQFLNYINSVKKEGK